MLRVVASPYESLFESSAVRYETRSEFSISFHASENGLFISKVKHSVEEFFRKVTSDLFALYLIMGEPDVPKDERLAVRIKLAQATEVEYGHLRIVPLQRVAYSLA